MNKNIIYLSKYINIYCNRKVHTTVYNKKIMYNNTDLYNSNKNLHKV